MTPETLEKVGLALYGRCWKLAMAEALNISERALRRMSNGSAPIPDGICRELFVLCNDRATELECLLPLL